MRTDLPQRHGNRHDFDFLFGDWHVTHRRLATRLRGAGDWVSFEGSGHCEPRLDGLVNVEQLDCPSQGFSGMTVRAFDLAQRQWSIHWISSQRGVVEPPVHGGFDGHSGEFYGHDVEGGQQVLVRFRWQNLPPDAARWEQAFSLDGAQWELNWVMDFRRQRAAAQ